MEPLGYDTEPSVQEAEERFVEVSKAVRGVFAAHSGIRGWFSGKPGKEEERALFDATGVLLPLSLKEVVQKGQTEKATLQAIAELQQEILLFCAKHGFGGVTVVEGPMLF